MKWLAGLAVISSGTVEEKVSLLFDIYDFGGTVSQCRSHTSPGSD